jgi:hypothetical protein
MFIVQLPGGDEIEIPRPLEAKPAAQRFLDIYVESRASGMDRDEALAAAAAETLPAPGGD